MKKITLVLSALIIFISCDKVTNPIIPKQVKVVLGSNTIKNSNKDVADSKKTLLEDYTGHRCPNCPDAAAVIEGSGGLIATYGTSLVVLSVHQGQLAQPFGTSWPEDYRTAIGEQWGGGAPGFGTFNQWPTGLINRKKYGVNDIKLDKVSWTSVMLTAKNDPFILKLDVNTEYDPTARALNVNVVGTFKLAYTNPVIVSVVYIEDSIIGKQDDHGNEIDDYEFSAMFRGSMNGAWGDNLTTTAALANSTATLSITEFGLPTVSEKGTIGQAINDKKVSVVVFAYDGTTKEVLQAEKVQIRP